jgi:hypothetical protein
MKTTLLFLLCQLFLTAFIQAGQWDQTPFDVVSPRIPDRLCRVTLNRQELNRGASKQIPISETMNTLNSNN